jgi:hypothetical protein
MPGFTAEASSYRGGTGYRSRGRVVADQQVVPQAISDRCIGKALRLYDRCLSIGYDSYACARTAVDFGEFCESMGL